MKKRTVIISVLAVIAVVIVVFLVFGAKDKPNLHYDITTVGAADISNSVTATGTIEPVTQVDVGTQVSGIVSKLYVDYNSVVKKGQVIAELDKTNLISELNIAKAALNDAHSKLKYQKANYDRYNTLYTKGLVSADEYETALLAYRQAQDAVSQQKESVAKAQTNLGYATITSPIDGVVLAKEVEEGQTVAASFNTPTLFTIAQDLTDMRVIADVDEADIGEVKEGERVTFTVDAFPNDTFDGVVTQVRQEATTTNNVVTYQVVISAPNKSLKLKPGLTANVTIYTYEKKNVTSVPNKALRFTPTQELVGKAAIKDCKGTKKVWTYDGKIFKAYPVKTGLTDGINTEILEGVTRGQKVVVDVKQAEGENKPEAQQQEASPFAPKHPGKKK
ncbi:MAG: efflux RND transporter periplasmic adaptor subunit [Prevotella sp.]